MFYKFFSLPFTLREHNSRKFGRKPEDLPVLRELDLLRLCTSDLFFFLFFSKGNEHAVAAWTYPHFASLYHHHHHHHHHQLLSFPPRCLMFLIDMSGIVFMCQYKPCFHYVFKHFTPWDFPLCTHVAELFLWIKCTCFSG